MSTRTLIDATSQGVFRKQGCDAAWQLLDDMSYNSSCWPSERSNARKMAAGMYEVDPMTTLTAQLSVLSTQVAQLANKQSPQLGEPSLVYQVGEGPSSGVEEAHYINNRNHNPRFPNQGNQFSNSNQ